MTRNSCIALSDTNGNFPTIFRHKLDVIRYSACYDESHPESKISELGFELRLQPERRSLDCSAILTSISCEWDAFTCSNAQEGEERQSDRDFVKHLVCSNLKIYHIFVKIVCSVCISSMTPVGIVCIPVCSTLAIQARTTFIYGHKSLNLNAWHFKTLIDLRV